MIDRDLPLKKEIASNIKRLMKERGWTQIKLSDKAGISKSTLSDYINCKTLINPGNVEKLATAFEVNKSDIDPSFKVNDVDVVNEIASRYITNIDITEYVEVPILGSVAAGTPITRIEHNEGYLLLPKNLTRNRTTFALNVKGDSMIGDGIYDGDIVIVAKDVEVYPNDIAVVAVNNEEATIKRVKCEKDMCMLIPSNPNMQPKLEHASNIHIIGKVIESRRNFE